MPGAFARAIKNPRRVKLLWQHDFKTPIGKITKLWDDERGLRFRGKLNIKTDWGRNAYEALLAGDVDANSIGYNEIKGKNAINQEDGVKDLNELDLWEISTVSFPSNEAATVDEVKTDVEEPEELDGIKTLIPYKKTALAPEGQAWDGPGQVSGATPEQLRAMCACIDGDPANSTSYKLPHHMKSGACVWAGVRAAYAATQGARGGVQGCGGAEGHLLKHYDDFNKPRPGKSDEPEEEKAGRVLSGVNMDDITALRDNLAQGMKYCDAILGRAAPKPAAPEPAPKSFSVENLSGDELKIKLSKINEQLKGIL